MIFVYIVDHNCINSNHSHVKTSFQSYIEMCASKEIIISTWALIACFSDLFFCVSSSTSRLQLQSTEIQQQQKSALCTIKLGPDL